MLSNSQIKRVSRKQLKRQWIGFGIFYILYGILAGGIYTLIKDEVISLLVSLPISVYFSIVGTKMSTIVANNKRLTMKDLSISPKAFFNMIGFDVVYILINSIIGILLVFIVASFTTATIMGVPDIYSPDTIIRGLSRGQITVVSISILIYIIFSVYIDLVYQFAPFAIAKNIENVGFIKAMKFSRKAVRGHKLKLLGLMISFIGWYVLPLILIIGINIANIFYPIPVEMNLLGPLITIAIFIIIFIWLIPYIYTSIANFFYELVLEKNELAIEMGIVTDENRHEFRTITEAQLIEYGVIKLTHEETVENLDKEDSIEGKNSTEDSEETIVSDSTVNEEYSEDGIDVNTTVNESEAVDSRSDDLEKEIANSKEKGADFEENYSDDNVSSNNDDNSDK